MQEYKTRRKTVDYNMVLGGLGITYRILDMTLGEVLYDAWWMFKHIGQLYLQLVAVAWIIYSLITVWTVIGRDIGMAELQGQVAAAIAAGLANHQNRIAARRQG